MTQLDKLMNNETARQLALFVIVGGVTFVLDVASTSVLYYYAGLPAYLASGIGFMVGFLFSFPMNRKKVFRHDVNSHFQLKTQVLLFLTLSVLNLGISSYGVELIVHYKLMEIQYAKTLVTVIIACWNFLLFKHFIFKKALLVVD